MTAATGGSIACLGCRMTLARRHAGPAISYLHRQRRQLVGCRANLVELALGQRDQALVGEVALLAYRGVAGELRDELADARHRVGMRVLDVEIERARDRVLAVGDVLEGRLDPLDRAALQLVDVLVE